MNTSRLYSVVPRVLLLAFAMQGIAACSAATDDGSRSASDAITTTMPGVDVDPVFTDDDLAIDEIFDNECDVCGGGTVLVSATPSIGAFGATPNAGTSTISTFGFPAPETVASTEAASLCSAQQPRSRAGAAIALAKKLLGLLKSGAKFLGPKSLAALKGLGKVLAGKKFETVVTTAVALDLIAEFTGVKKAMMDEAAEKRKAGDEAGAKELEDAAKSMDSFTKAVEALKDTLDRIAALEAKIKDGTATDNDKQCLAILKTTLQQQSAVIAALTKELSQLGGE
jgi:hypothetical protein